MVLRQPYSVAQYIKPLIYFMVQISWVVQAERMPLYPS